jgi:protein gp37
MGCDGCELLNSAAKTVSALTAEIVKNTPGATGAEIKPMIESILGDLETTQILAGRETLVDRIVKNTKCDESLRSPLLEVIKSQVICYAAQLHAMRGGTIKGYAQVFERPEMFPGRVAVAANWKPLLGTKRPDKSWLDDCRRMVFVSDMGDALSTRIPFDYLKTEIIDVVGGEKGARHIWLWLTKRPSRMAEFAKHLADAGVQWPANLVAMTSVTSMRTVPRIAQLLKVPAMVRCLSVEPLWERVTLPLEGISWVIIGGQSGRNAKPFDLAWARDLLDQCEAAGVPCFMKQLGSNPIQNGTRLKLKDRHGGDWEEWPADLQIREVPPCFKSM